MGSIEELVSEIRRVRTLVGRARQAIAVAELRIATAGEAFSAATAGSAVSEPAEASGHCAFAALRTAEALATLCAVVDRLDRYLEGLGATTAPARSGYPISTHPAAPVSPERVEALRDEPPETVVRGSGQKTHGRWVGPDGVAHEIVSPVMALEIWYDQEPENDLGPGDPAIVIAEVEDLDAFVDRVLRESAGHVVPPMIQASVAGHPEFGVLEAGLGPERDFVNLLSGDGGISSGDPSQGRLVLYDYMGTTTEVDAAAEIPVEAVRRGLREFMVNDGRKPESLRWLDA